MIFEKQEYLGNDSPCDVIISHSESNYCTNIFMQLNIGHSVIKS